MSIIRIETLGCRLNQIESESIARFFLDKDFSVRMDSVTASEAADCETLLCIVNTCAVTLKAEQKARRIIRLLLKKHPRALIVVTGCYAQLSSSEIEKLDERIVVVGGQIKSRLSELPGLLKAYADGIETESSDGTETAGSKIEALKRSVISLVKTKPVEKKAEEPKKEAAKPANTELQLCFVNIDGDGSVVRQVIKRQVAKSDSPLTTAINLLLQGPDTTKSAERNCMTLIPAGTKLLSAKVQDGVAYLNFNEAFEINTYGVEGYIHQLEQIVFTATAFSTVNSVQLLIEGEKRDYLGSEGQWIGSPLSRSSF